MSSCASGRRARSANSTLHCFARRFLAKARLIPAHIIDLTSVASLWPVFKVYTGTCPSDNGRFASQRQSHALQLEDQGVPLWLSSINYRSINGKDEEDFKQPL